MKWKWLFQFLSIAIVFVLTSAASAQFCRNCVRSSTRTVTKSYGSAVGVTQSYGSAGGVVTQSYGSSGGSYVAQQQSYGSSGGTPTQVMRRPRLFQRRNRVERSVIESAPVNYVEQSEGMEAARTVQCPFCGRLFVIYQPSPYPPYRAKEVVDCKCCDKCTGQPGCDCGCPECHCNDKARKDDPAPLNPDRPPGYKSENKTDSPKAVTAAPPQT